MNSRLPTHFGLSVGWESSSTFLAMGRALADRVCYQSDPVLVVRTVTGTPCR